MRGTAPRLARAADVTWVMRSRRAGAAAGAGALDSSAAAEIMDILAELNVEGTTVMLVTHDPRVAARTERVLYMVDGRLVGDRHQDRYAGTDLDRRQTELSRWLVAGVPVGA